MRKFFFVSGLVLAMSVRSAFGLTFTNVSTCKYELNPSLVAAPSQVTVSNCSEYGEYATYWKQESSGAITSTVYSIEECNVCKSGYTRKLLTYTSSLTSCKFSYYGCQTGTSTGTCPTACPSTTTWRSIGSGRQARCVQGTNTKYCTYRCASGYYAKSFTNTVINGEGTMRIVSTCATCPSYATCSAGLNPPICNASYYRTSTSSTSGIVTTTTYSCSPCPSYTEGGAAYRGSSDRGSTSRTQCYIPDGTNRSTTTGTYEYVGDCYYKENVVSGGGSLPSVGG